jgi:hypothetical protein
MAGLSMSKLPRTLRLDPSDTFIFERAADAGEWAISGAFIFWNVDPDTLGPKQRAALRAGFLGLASFGWSTLCTVTPVTAEERVAIVEDLATRLMQAFGAPSIEDARAAAEEEIAFAEGLCDHPEGTVLAVQRQVEEGEIRERFRTLHAREKDASGRDGLHAGARAFTFHEMEGDDDAPQEEVDLIGLMDKNT